MEWLCVTSLVVASGYFPGSSDVEGKGCCTMQVNMEWLPVTSLVVASGYFPGSSDVEGKGC